VCASEPYKCSYELASHDQYGEKAVTLRPPPPRRTKITKRHNSYQSVWCGVCMGEEGEGGCEGCGLE